MGKFLRAYFLVLVAAILLSGGARCWAAKKQLNYTVAQKEWGLAANALLTWSNNDDFFSLPGRWNSPYAIHQVKRWILEDDWGIGSRKELIQTLNKVWKRGHRGSMQEIKRELEMGWSPQIICLYARFRGHHCSFRRIGWVRDHADELDENSMVGWDLARVISLARWGVHVGYLSEEEAWEWIMPAAQKIQTALSSWQELGEDYLFGRSFWSPRTMRKDGDKLQSGIYWLIHAPGSPWGINDWNLDLTESVEPPEEKALLPETAHYFEGVDWSRQKKYSSAVKSYRHSIKEDRPLYKGCACGDLGDFYRWGKEGIETNETLAFQFYRQGAELQDANCLNSVGWRYYWKDKNYSKALEHLMKAAECGSVYALRNLGILYNDKKSGMKDTALAFRFFSESVQWGCGDANNRLAWLMYKNPEYWDIDRAVKLAYEAVEYEKTLYTCDTLMRVLIKAKRYPEALKAWQDWASFYKQRANNWDDLALPEHVKKVRRDILEKLNG